MSLQTALFQLFKNVALLYLDLTGQIGSFFYNLCYFMNKKKCFRLYYLSNERWWTGCVSASCSSCLKCSFSSRWCAKLFFSLFYNFPSYFPSSPQCPSKYPSSSSLQTWDLCFRQYYVENTQTHFLYLSENAAALHSTLLNKVDRFPQ